MVVAEDMKLRGDSIISVCRKQVIENLAYYFI